MSPNSHPAPYLFREGGDSVVFGRHSCPFFYAREVLFFFNCLFFYSFVPLNQSEIIRYAKFQSEKSTYKEHALQKELRTVYSLSTML